MLLLMRIRITPLQRGIVPQWVGEEDVPGFVDTLSRLVEAGSVGSW